MSILCLGTFVETMKHCLEIPNRNDLVGFLLCLPIEVEARKDYFNKAGDLLVNDCLGRPGVHLERARENRICSISWDQQHVYPAVREAFRDPDNREAMEDRMYVFLNRQEFGLARTDRLFKEMCKLLNEDINIPASSKKELLKYETDSITDLHCGFYLDLLIYALDVRVKPQTVRQVFKSKFAPRLTDFIGRSAELDDIKKILSNNQCVVLNGMGGMGKTQLAFEYIRNNLNSFTFIWLINGSSVQSIVESYREFLKANHEDTDYTDPRMIISSFITFVDTHTGWMLVYDNCDYASPAAFREMLALLPTNPTAGKIIITTRASFDIANYLGYKVPPFSTQDSVHFLLSRLNSDDEKGAAELADRLGCFPLALEYAAAFIKRNPPHSFLEYICLLNKNGSTLLDQETKVMEYKYALNDVIDLSLKRIRKDSDPKAFNCLCDLLVICAFMEPYHIDLRMFKFIHSINIDEITYKAESALGFPFGQSDLCEQCAEELNLIKLKNYVTQYSLFDMDDDGFLRLHPLLQEKIRDKLPKEIQYEICRYLENDIFKHETLIENSVAPDVFYMYHVTAICRNLYRLNSTVKSIKTDAKAKSINRIFYHQFGALLLDVSIWNTPRSVYDRLMNCFKQWSAEINKYEYAMLESNIIFYFLAMQFILPETKAIHYVKDEAYVCNEMLRTCTKEFDFVFSQIQTDKKQVYPKPAVFGRMSIIVEVCEDVYDSILHYLSNPNEEFVLPDFDWFFQELCRYSNLVTEYGFHIAQLIELFDIWNTKEMGSPHPEAFEKIRKAVEKSMNSYFKNSTTIEQQPE